MNINIIIENPLTKELKVIYGAPSVPVPGQRIFLGYNPAPAISDVVLHYPTSSTPEEDKDVVEAYVSLARA